MKIGSINEDLGIEKRISITPEIAKKYSELGLEIFINQNYAKHLGISDKEYENKGAKILKDKKEIIQNVDLSLLVNFPKLEDIKLFKENSSMVGIFDPYKNIDIINLPYVLYMILLIFIYS